MSGYLNALIISGFVACLCSVSTGGEKKTAQLAKTRHQAAENAYRAIAENEQQLRSPVEYDKLYSWSIRILDAQKELDPREEKQLAAFMNHLERMTDVEQKVSRDVQKRRLNPSANVEVEYFKLEAEYWVEKAKLLSQQRKRESRGK
jgi:hypothetical protein